MSLVPGQTLTHYEILGPLGAGGMGEVWRARDTRLEREVAIKVLPEDLADDEERLRRFEREAKTLASVNHPNLAHVYGIDQVEDTGFIAMELVPGEDLAARLGRGALPLAEVLAIGRQIAEGVEAAHEAGVVHRDLKPANVVVTPEGRVKLLDFGLAKPLREANGAQPASALTTEEGRLLGTPAYMAPEQVRGKPIDRRVDVWAFGCLLYECLTGRRVFEGETLSDVLAAVLEREPDVSRLPASTPTRLTELIERCLRKDPRQRMRDVGDARILLEELIAAPDPEPAAPPVDGRRAVVAVLATTTLVASAAAVWFWRAAGASSEPRLEAVNALTNSPAWSMGGSWSPRGERFVYAEQTERGLDLFVKPSEGGVPELLVSTPGDDLAPRFSPDGRTIAFVSSSEPGCPVFLVGTQGGEEPRLVIETGLPRLALTEAAYGLGDRPWLPDGRSLLVSIVTEHGRMAIHEVDLETGEARQLTFPGPGEDDYAASLSFDGERVVFHRQALGGADLWTMPAGGGEPEVLLRDEPASLTPVWRPDGRRVVFRRSTQGGYYDVWEIDTRSGDLRRITFETRRAWCVSVSVDDRIAFAAAEHDTFLHAMARSGGDELTKLNAHTGDNFGARPAPAGKHGGWIAYHANRTGNPEIWLLDPASGQETQLTDNPATELYPDWSPAGDELVIVSNERGPFQLFVLDVERRTRRHLVDKPLSIHGSNLINASIVSSWSPDPEDPRIAFVVSGDGGYTLWTVRPDGTELTEALQDVYSFDWYVDSRRGLLTRVRADGRTDLVAAHLETGATRVLATIPHMELKVAPDGTAVSFCSGEGHMSMDLWVLELEPPAHPDGLPTAAGEPVRRTAGEGRWHVHNGGWTPDSQTLVFTRDEDYGDAYEVIESR